MHENIPAKIVEWFGLQPCKNALQNVNTSNMKSAIDISLITLNVWKYKDKYLNDVELYDSN